MTLNSLPPPPAPATFQKMWWNKKVDAVTKLYIVRCSDKPLFNERNRMTSQYFCIRHFFEKKTDSDVSKVYEYLYDMPEDKIMGLSEVFRLAETTRVKRREERDQKTIKTDQYKEYSVEDLL